MKKLCASVAFVVVGSGAFAASPDPVVLEPPVLAPLFSWAGGYIGAQAGYLDSDIDLSGVNTASTPPRTMSTSDLNASGAVGGIFAGYNWQRSANLVYGVEAEINGTDADKSGAGVPSPGFGFIRNGIKSEIDWNAALRGRVGYAMDRTLFYAAGGVAFADVNLDGTAAGGPGTFSYSETLTGWTIGAGVEHAFTDNWVARLDYRYSDYGDDSFTFIAPGSGDLHRFKLDAVTHEVKAGISYKF